MQGQNRIPLLYCGGIVLGTKLAQNWHKTGTKRGCNSVVEYLLPKQVVVGSIPITRSTISGTKKTPNAMSGVRGL